MAKKKYNAFEQVYNISEDPALTSRVASVICVMVQRGLLVAGFSSKKELLTLHYTGYNKSKIVWEINFFEQIMTQEPLLSDKTKIKAVFLLGNKNLIVPDELYEKPTAENWLRKLFFIEQTDIIQHHPLRDLKAQYLLAVPVNITELIRINFKSARTMVLPHYQLTKPAKGISLQCCVTSAQVCASLLSNGKLLWHRVFDYANTEDIAYALLQVCQEHNIDPDTISLPSNTISAAEYNTVSGLSRFFPSLLSGDGGPLTNSWDGTIKLAQQLLACVS